MVPARPGCGDESEQMIFVASVDVTKPKSMIFPVVRSLISFPDPVSLASVSCPVVGVDLQHFFGALNSFQESGKIRRADRQRRRTDSLVQPSNNNAHEDHSQGVISDLLDHDRIRHWLHCIIDKIGRDGHKYGYCHTKADSLHQKRPVLLPLDVNPNETDCNEHVRQQHVGKIVCRILLSPEQTRQLSIILVEKEPVDKETKSHRQDKNRYHRKQKSFVKIRAK